MNQDIFSNLIISNPDTLPEFSKKNVETSFVYFLWYEQQIVYIGETVSLESRINQHKNDKLFDKVTYQILYGVSSTERKLIERKNINHYKPIFNDDASAILKTKEFCYCRNGGKGIYYKLDKFELDVYGKDAYYYNGELLQSVHVQPYKVVKKIDLKVVETVSKPSSEDCIIQLVNKELQVLILNDVNKFERGKGASVKKKYNNPKLTLDLKMRFGKYKGSLIQAIALTDKEYIRWLIGAYDGVICQTVKNELKRIDNRGN